MHHFSINTVNSRYPPNITGANGRLLLFELHFGLQSLSRTDYLTTGSKLNLLANLVFLHFHKYVYYLHFCFNLPNSSAMEKMNTGFSFLVAMCSLSNNAYPTELW